MIRVAWIVEKSGFQKNFEKFWLRKFYRYVAYRTSCIESSPGALDTGGIRFRARVAKGRPGFRDHISRGKPRIQNRMSKGSCRLRKPNKYFRLIMIRVAWNMNKCSFQKNFYFIWKSFDFFKIFEEHRKNISAHIVSVIRDKREHRTFFLRFR